jgi:uncharacterized protein (TIGR02246 family)
MGNEAVIKQLIENWAEAVRKEDINAILANHSEDILMFDVPEPLQSKGMAAYKKTWDAYFAWSQHSGVFDIEECKITAGSDVAYCHAIIRCAGKGSNGEKTEYMVRLTICLAKVKGQWKITHEHHSIPAV